MNILFITPLDPYECATGGGVRTKLIWQALKSIGDVYTTVIDCWHDQRRSKLAGLEEKIKHVPDFDAYLRNRRFRWFVFKNFLRGCVDSEFMSGKEVQRRLGWHDVNFDVVVVRFLWLVPHTAPWKIAPTVVDIDDLPIEDFNTLERKSLSWYAAIRRGWTVRFWQAFALKMTKGSWLPNKFQIKYVCRHNKCLHLPNVVTLPRKDYDADIQRKDLLITVGSLNYSPNRDGIDWFLHEVWPKFHKLFPKYEYAIAGHKLPAEYRSKWSALPGVRVLGFVDDLSYLYASCMAVVAPIFTGGGTAVKVIEALAHGRKVFGTQFALRGVSDRERALSAIVQFSTCDEFISAFRNWSSMPDSEKEAERENMRTMLCENYSVEYFNKQIATLVHETIEQ